MNHMLKSLGSVKTHVSTFNLSKVKGRTTIKTILQNKFDLESMTVKMISSYFFVYKHIETPLQLKKKKNYKIHMLNLSSLIFSTFYLAHKHDNQQKQIFF